MPKLTKKNSSETLSIGIWHIVETKDELLRMVTNNGFDIKKIIETKSETRLKQWLAIRLLLHDFYPNVLIDYNQFGKPYLSNGTELSISHAGDYAVIALNSEKKCGIDIEKISAKVERIKNKFLNSTELETTTSLEALTIFWCAKEALYKLYGEKEIIFNEQLFITEEIKPYRLKGRIKTTKNEEYYDLEVEKIDDYILVYTI